MKKFCSNCGKPLAADSKFCSYCGKSTTDDDKQKLNTQESNVSLGEADRLGDSKDTYKQWNIGIMKHRKLLRNKISNKGQKKTRLRDVSVIVAVLACFLIIFGVYKFKEHQLLASVSGSYYMHKYGDGSMDIYHFTRNGAVQGIHTGVIYNYVGGENTSREWESKRINNMKGHMSLIQNQVYGTGNQTILANVTLIYDEIGDWSMKSGRDGIYDISFGKEKGKVFFYSMDKTDRLSNIGRILDVDQESRNLSVDTKGQVRIYNEKLKKMDKNVPLKIKYLGDNDNVSDGINLHATPKDIYIQDLFKIVHFEHK